jgi:hypothetical protein
MLRAVKSFPAIILTGPRRSGKTTLLVRDRNLLIVEAKASKTVIPQMADSLVRLSNAVSDYDVECVVLHRPSKEGPGFSSLRPGVKALTMEGFLERLGSRF